MEKKKSNYSTISKIGPLYKIEGGLIFKPPFVSLSLEGFEDANALRNSGRFLTSISDRASKWFKKFPNCCDTHREISQSESFNKENFEFIPSQILNNVKYFVHALETFIGEENGMSEIKDYLDYLKESLGIPHAGGDIFIEAVQLFIEKGTLDNKEFTDDQRLELLERISKLLLVIMADK